MSRMTKWLVLGLTIFTLAACGKSEDEKAQERAMNAKNEQNALADYLSRNVPDYTWSNAELDAYEAKLHRLLKVEAEVREADGKNGVRVTSPADNTAFVNRRLWDISKIRASKRSAG